MRGFSHTVENPLHCNNSRLFVRSPNPIRKVMGASGLRQDGPYLANSPAAPVLHNDVSEVFVFNRMGQPSLPKNQICPGALNVTNMSNSKGPSEFYMSAVSDDSSGYSIKTKQPSKIQPTQAGPLSTRSASIKPGSCGICSPSIFMTFTT